MMVLDRTNFALHLDHLDKYIKHLEVLKNKHSKDEILKNWEVQDKIERKMQLAIECMLDIGDVVISGYDFQKPTSYREVISILADNRVIASNIEELKKLAGFRNVLVHDYLYLDLEKVYKNFITLSDYLKKFVEEIKKFVNKSK